MSFNSHLTPSQINITTVYHEEAKKEKSSGGYEYGAGVRQPDTVETLMEFTLLREGMTIRHGEADSSWKQSPKSPVIHVKFGWSCRLWGLWEH